MKAYTIGLYEKAMPNTLTWKEKLEAEGHTVIARGRKNIRYYVEDYEKVLFEIE